MADEREGGRKPRPRLTQAGKGRAAARHTRLVAALRENLRRRKAQSRAREGTSARAPDGKREE